MPGIHNWRFKFMPYLLKIPHEQMKDLWRLREFAGKGPIVAQARKAISDYLCRAREEIGAPIQDIEEATKRHRREERMSR